MTAVTVLGLSALAACTSSSTSSGAPAATSQATGPITIGASLSLTDWKSTRLNSSHGYISYAVFCLKKKTPFLRSNVLHHYPIPRPGLHHVAPDPCPPALLLSSVTSPDRGQRPARPHISTVPCPAP